MTFCFIQIFIHTADLQLPIMLWPSEK